MSITSSTQVNQNTSLADNDSKAIFGFWVYLMTDCILFASLFATYVVLRNNTFGGTTTHEIFHLPYILVETLILLTSSFTCGLAMLAVNRKVVNQAMIWFGATFLLGLTFLSMELSEFGHLVSEGHSWRASSFLSSYFTLVGTHGLHISIGLIWIVIMLLQIGSKGLTRNNIRRLTMLSLFWHFLDIIWIFIFTIVYLVGVS